MGARTTIYLTSKSEEESQILRNRLEPHLVDVGFISVRPAGLLATPEAREAKLIILNFNEWSAHELHVVETVCSRFPGVPVLVMAKHQAPQELNAYLGSDTFAYLAKPVEFRDLLGLVRKILSTGTVATQVHRRYNTDQTARLEVDGYATPVLSRMRNLSKGGAFIEVGVPVDLNVGDSVRVKLELKQMNREYTMPAKVVWTKSQGIGVEFTGPGDVKKTILSAY